MGNRDRSTLGSDSGYGDDVASLKSLRSRCGSDAHPLTRKGYDIGPASRLQVGDVFEFLWADAAEFQWEWKCLGYTRFIVLRHSESFPHHCACIPINTGHVGKQDFAKPSIDHFQQGFVYANGDSNPGCEQPSGGIKLPYSPVAIELRPGRLRVKPDSRANYADIVNVDYEAQVMVVGDVVRYFDRVRRNVNKAFMRQILRKALEKYQEEKAKKFEEQKQTEGLKADEEQANDPGLTQLQDQTDGSVETAESIDGDLGGADCRQHEHEILSPADAQPGVKSGTQADMQAESSAEYALESIPEIVEGAAPIESAPEPEPKSKFWGYARVQI
ncbi:hypothetical protein F4780DRAFT_796796 [Xylariomycetidae sp. FL0641]|nr:hypothetical protein F4780DRAFT_796796 [Xylariomycetidae sp. FL0641]